MGRMTEEGFFSSEEARQLFFAWQNHEDAFFIGEERFPILSWNETQFAARNIKSKLIIVGTKTRTNRYVVMKVDPGTLWQPNIAALASTMLNLWSRNLF